MRWTILLALGCTTPAAPLSNHGTSTPNGPTANADAINGGIIEFDPKRKVAATNAATHEMTAHCGAGKYVITREGEEPLDPARPGQTVWRIHYACR
jgi:hypothetical protein